MLIDCLDESILFTSAFAVSHYCKKDYFKRRITNAARSYLWSTNANFN